MSSAIDLGPALETAPLTPSTWEDFEAYPTLPRDRELAPVSSFMGIPQSFVDEGFIEVARPSASRVVLRRIIAERPAR